METPPATEGFFVTLPSGSGFAQEHRLRLAELQEAVLPTFHADAGLFVPAKGCVG